MLKMAVRRCERRRITTPGNILWIDPRCPDLKPSPPAFCLMAWDWNGSYDAASPHFEFRLQPLGDDRGRCGRADCPDLVGATLSTSYAFVLDHYAELAWLTAGAILWTITEPLRGIGTRLSVEVSRFALKWGLLAKVCVRRYCRYVRGPAVQGKPFRTWLWKTYEAILATPMVVLEANKVHDQGLGRLLFKWLDALHEYWCVFLPTSWALVLRSLWKYYKGVGVESSRSAARARLVGRLAWTLSSLLVYASFFGLLFAYEFVEWACRGLLGVVVLMIAVNYGTVEEGGRSLGEIWALNSTLVKIDALLAPLSLSCRLWRCNENNLSERFLLELARDGYASWCLALEEQEQDERLSEAFWHMDGCEDAPRAPVRTRCGLQAERRALKAKRERDDSVEPRRGRRVPVGEDVSSWNGGHRLGTVGRSESGYDAVWSDYIVPI
ncbi:hypothetical protein PR003_g12992 [Phytophthora rubi]|uniref:Uncharacterized protein n=1 Tax=Phytophthora rubi TaxID=129364 RepID=A0A6A4F7R2_9STRA|nr:hypothetical protein PR003_g12992 [Phytophthora rubi]